MPDSSELVSDTSEEMLAVPLNLQPQVDKQFPVITPSTLAELQQLGWKRIGIMVAFVDIHNQIMLLTHNERDKNDAEALGPLGETMEADESVLATLYHGIAEELGVTHVSDLELFTHTGGGWVVNQWPRGKNYPHEYSCAISFPVFMSAEASELFRTRSVGTEEVGGLGFYEPDFIHAAPDDGLRPGVKRWLGELEESGLLEWPSQLQPVDFSPLQLPRHGEIELA